MIGLTLIPVFGYNNPLMFFQVRHDLFGRHEFPERRTLLVMITLVTHLFIILEWFIIGRPPHFSKESKSPGSFPHEPDRSSGVVPDFI